MKENWKLNVRQKLLEGFTRYFAQEARPQLQERTTATAIHEALNNTSVRMKAESMTASIMQIIQEELE